VVANDRRRAARRNALARCLLPRLRDGSGDRRLAWRPKGHVLARRAAPIPILLYVADCRGSICELVHTRSAELWYTETIRFGCVGGVHFYFDEEFARGRAATIAALQAQRYRNVLDAFDGSLTAFSKTPPDGKGAIRQTFAAAEGLFRLMIPNAPRLTAKELDRLQPFIHKATVGNPTAASAASKLLTSFKDWVDAAHFYRHEAGVEEVSQPPLTLAVHMTSLGASFIRWLAELDTAP
jgi:hypothetical protein